MGGRGCKVTHTPQQCPSTHCVTAVLAEVISSYPQSNNFPVSVNIDALKEKIIFIGTPTHTHAHTHTHTHARPHMHTHTYVHFITSTYRIGFYLIDYVVCLREEISVNKLRP